MYDHQKMDLTLVRAVSIVPANPVAGSPMQIGYQPVLVRAVWACITTITAAAIITLTYKYRPTPGSATGEIILGVLTIPVAAPVGNMYYEKVAVEPTKCLPGGEIVVEAVGAGTGSATLGVFAEHSWDIPANNPRMIAA